jgi:hypothetical protein
LADGTTGIAGLSHQVVHRPFLGELVVCARL